MVVLKFKIHEEDLIAIEGFLFDQEWEEKPEFDEIELVGEENTYNYKLVNEFGKWYIATC